ncbi:UDP-glucose 6-dehydrogenase [Rhodobacter sp. NTK016B]|uniref:UDP-glucose 6-dehydrogenase n=1 Tax=Rhodobacter sp. NTK016B TaxID=2759676 RepID=UPI001A8FDD1D|nr:UDP-glucose 6-dehydrogenase [Rhodobacter sp. NTK016B]MBN8291201.1 UDP-glucose 6-dehydrogenase [Rhodobacter sp. NTK016B]
MRIAVAGLGAVGLANAILLARLHDVVALDPRPGRVAMVNRGLTPVDDPECAEYLASGMLNLRATLCTNEAFRGAEVVIVAPPPADTETERFDTAQIEALVERVHDTNPHALIVIRATVPVGFTAALIEKTGCKQILVVPDFHREGRALYDNLYPARIVVGEVSTRGTMIANLFRGAALTRDIAILQTAPTEAEAIKIFTASYLTLRMSFFNELDTIALAADLNVREVIETLGSDPLVGRHDDNPGFGFGGPFPARISRQVLESFGTVPQHMMRAIVDGDDARKEALTQAILSRRPHRVGIHRPVAGRGGDENPDTAMRDILVRLASCGVELVVYEPGSHAREACGYRIETDFGRFADGCDLIVANAMTPDLAGLGPKVFTRDLFSRG